MKKKTIFILAIFCLIINTKGVAQKIDIGVETGFSAFSIEMNDIDNIRDNASNYYGGYIEDGVFSAGQRYNAGLKIDYLTPNNHFELSSGLRYSRMTKIVENGSYFYFLIETPQDVEYLRLTTIAQKSDYLGIPFDVKFFPRDEIHFFNQFFSLGTDFNFLINNKNDISYYKKEFNADDEVNKNIKDPGNFFGSVYAGIGFRFGKKDCFATVIQAFFPCIYYTSSGSFGLVKPVAMEGAFVELELRIPIK